MSKLYDVIIAGAGPIGLFVACELGLARVSVLVLERDLKAESPWKGDPLGFRGITTPSLESFYRRGLLGKLFGPDERPSSYQKKPGFNFGGHFAGIPLNANKLDMDRWKYRIPGPALVPGPTTIEHVEAVLTERAEQLGITILRGDGVTKIVSQDHDTVTVEAGENQTFRAKWLVGCDGGRSLVRKSAGFDFVGTEPKFTGYVVQCEWDHPERLKPGFHVTKAGLYIVRMPETLYLTDFDGGAFDRSAEVGQQHIQSVFRRVSGITDVQITKIHLASTFTDRCKQATSYRKGRVLLAGDAAHIHGPLGGQGLNLGLGDAMNLGWKLAATIRRESGEDGNPADLALLDTYESERHPAGVRVLQWTRAQVAVLQPDPYGEAVQAIVRDLIDTTDGANYFMGRFSGMSQRYVLGDGEAYAHPLVGASAPDFELHDGSRLGSKFEGGRGLLIDFENDATLKKLIVDGEYEDRVEYIGIGAKDTRGLRALLVRPDGIVAWVVDEHAKPDMVAAKAALERWFGL
ncbi:uncharacterized protein Z520_04619 [Fonsecaea multimorphosa CBS 102226]|uniref:FAD-binding domain-containing protein n=1 Tax=Fonsecaea multimorphosa CBS 102226 TaxID=1442371 RepID=A0A0D2ISP3_9EURO|nr:uncharacterized protein Z520_04619 [Fonsecaea multimorphosa CBS 102226]KIX99981.1 hypothetical protein Z520_04619 [Fonsecaea multimorphosa CBS 102226]OAL26195.1 hypothetical protein AYO22_04373 [Fonsecaea multimorphosa]